MITCGADEEDNGIFIRHCLYSTAAAGGQAEGEFRVEVEAIGHVQHKNLEWLLGYCVEGIHRERIIWVFFFSLCLALGYIWVSEKLEIVHG
ncbi:hypothetical protein MRB53_013165 [Persea americana]|uniref:Uncharacterized protein n=1 Tax=Persea americana TaxID=3435 RepID=A0ACC2K7Q0_PERAE|nr:hypothetical protein MRB53_013165 [Persea americana]